MIKITPDLARRLNIVMSADDVNIAFPDRIAKQKKFVQSIFGDIMASNEEIDMEIVEKLYQASEECVRYYLSGNIVSSVNSLREILFPPEEDKFYEVSLVRNNVLLKPGKLLGFRIRSTGSNSLYKRDEMFHIPFEKRHLVSNQRFSLTGYPCLYIGSSIYGSWEEVNRPNIDTCNIVSIKNSQLIKMIDLRLPHFEEEKVVEYDSSVLYRSIVAWLCSFRAKEKGASFIVEYVIPQMLTAALVKSIPEHTQCAIMDCLYPSGIIYTSSLYNTDVDIFHDADLFTNYVIPVQNNSQSGLCSYLCSHFSITDPTSLLIERVKNTDGAMIAYTYESKGSYNITEFGQLESKLKSRKYYTLNY